MLVLAAVAAVTASWIDDGHALLTSILIDLEEGVLVHAAHAQTARGCRELDQVVFAKSFH